MKNKKKVKYTIYLSEDLADYIKEQAFKTHQSMNEIIYQLLKETKGSMNPHLIVFYHLEIIKNYIEELKKENDKECNLIFIDIDFYKTMGKTKEEEKKLEELGKKSLKKATYARILRSIEVIKEVLSRKKIKKKFTRKKKMSIIKYTISKKIVENF